jgi:hypothetical protein
MEQYIGLDVSMKETAISIRQDGKRIWRGKCASDPQLLAAVIRKRAPYARRVVFETGPLSVWFYHALTAEGLPVICIDARHAKAALDMAANKTDANDADGLAHLAEVGFYREVRVKGFDSMLIRTLITARRQLLKMRLQISNQIRGLMKTFGLASASPPSSTHGRSTVWVKKKRSATFRYKDYRRPGADRQQVMTLATDEFIRRFLLHVLPRGFHRIRHYGLLASSSRKTSLALARELLAVAPPLIHVPPAEPNDFRPPCPCCGGRMIVIEVFTCRGQPRAPPHSSPSTGSSTP